MKKRLLLVFTIVMLLIVSSSYVYGEGVIVKNPSFETVNSGAVSDWTTSAFFKDNDITEFKVEQGAAHTGNNFVTIINKSDNDARYIQTIQVEENKTYRLSCWVKTENVSDSETGRGANISVEGKYDSSMDKKGTNGKWEQLDVYVETGKGINSFNLTIGLGGYSSMNKGKASFDDIAVEEALSVPKGSVLIKLAVEEKKPAEAARNAATGNNISQQLLGIAGINLWIYCILGVIIIVLLIILFKKSGKKTDYENDNSESRYRYRETEDAKKADEAYEANEVCKTDEAYEANEVCKTDEAYEASEAYKPDKKYTSGRKSEDDTDDLI